MEATIPNEGRSWGAWDLAMELNRDYTGDHSHKSHVIPNSDCTPDVSCGGTVLDLRLLTASRS